MKAPWFVRCHGFYRPVRWPGWIVYALAVGFCYHLFRYYDARVHSVSDLFYHLFPFVVPTALIADRIAQRTCGKD